MIEDFFNADELTLVQWSVLIAFLIVYAIRCVHLLLIMARVLINSKKGVGEQKGLPLSMLITFRNEEESIRKSLPELLELKNSDFEVVVVDDFSQDNSLSVLGLFKQKYSRLKISSLSQETRYSVKLAQNIAMKSAAKDWVMILPSNLTGVREEWVNLFVHATAVPSANLIIGYSSITIKKGLFNLLYRLECFFQQIKSVGYVSCKVPFVYSEENMAFKKEKYFEAGAYGKNILEPYANMELVINSFIRKKQTVLNLGSESIIRKNIEGNRHEYFDLLKKSIRIEKHLPFWKKQLLFFDELTQLVFTPLLIAATLCCFVLWPVLGSLVLLRVLAQVFIIKRTQNRLNERKIFIPSLLYGLIMPYYRLFYRWCFNRSSRKQRWRNKA